MTIRNDASSPPRCRRTLLGITLAAAVSVAVGIAAQAPGTVGQTPQPSGRGGPSPGNAKASGAIRGHLVAADTSRPLRGARLQLTAPELAAPRGFITDVNGRFEIKGLAAGRYTLTAAAPGFITLSYGQSRPFEVGKPIALGEGQVVDELTMALPRSGAIAGTVRDEGGLPLIAANVTVSRAEFVRGVQQLASIGSGFTNDLGEFRISGLSPGAYLVSARKTFAGSSTDSETGYPRTFFPGTRDITTAKPVTVRLGQNTGDVWLVLSTAGASAIAGKWADQGGQSLLGLVRIRRADGLEETTGTNPTSGTFQVSALAPGEYDVSVVLNPLPAGRGGAPGNAPPRGAFSKVLLSGEYVTDVPLVLNPLSSVSGRLVVDPVARATLPSARVRIGTLPVNPSDAWIYPNTITPGDDLTFTIYAPPGRLLIRPTLPKGWTLKSIRLKGEDITDGGIEVRTGADTRDVEVEVTDRVSTVSGSVRNSKGDLVTDYTVLMFSRDRERWQGDGRYIATARPDQGGTFTIDSIVPGEYYVAALAYLDLGDAQNPSLLDRLQRDATLVLVRDGATTAVELKVMP